MKTEPVCCIGPLLNPFPCPTWVVSQAAAKASPKCGGGGRCSGIEKHDLPEDGRGENNIGMCTADGIKTPQNLKEEPGWQVPADIKPFSENRSIKKTWGSR